MKDMARKKIYISQSRGLLFLLIIFILLAACVFFFINGKKSLSYSIYLPESPSNKRIEFTYGDHVALSNPDFFKKAKEQFIGDKASFIEADLSKMILRVYKEGNLTLEVPIETKGREGSWWETPAGLYKIGTKEKKHFSSIGRVWMPWSMSFQGNFFIHGRTYNNDGKLSSAQFTGGCIRLSTENAEKVYELGEIGMPVLVFEDSFSPDTFKYHAAGPSLQAPIYLVGDLRSNHIFSEKNSTMEVPVASITKLVTALVTTEYINLDNIATVPESAIVYTSKPRLKVNEKYTVYNLLFPLLMESSNEAAETIARYYGRSNFIRKMNEKAAAIGMTHTHFADPSGASAENVSTAEDLFMLAKYIYNNRSFVFDITSEKIRNSAYGESDFKNLSNLNDFVDNRYFVGGKNGKTNAAAETNLSVFKYPIRDTTRPIVSIVLSSPNAKGDSEILLDFISKNFDSTGN